MTPLRPIGQNLDRELSQLAWCRRVLALAEDPTVPLLERLAALTTHSTQLDSFYEVRVARLKDLARQGQDTHLDGEVFVATLLARVLEAARVLAVLQDDILLGSLLPELEHANIHLLSPSTWTPEQRAWTLAYFHREVLPVLTPIGLDPSHPFPHVQSKQLNFVVTLTGDDAFERSSGIAVVQAPRALPRVVAMPTPRPGTHELVLLSAILQEHVAELFPGMTVQHCAAFRVTRDGQAGLSDDERDDVLETMQDERWRRHLGEPVRLEVAVDCPADLVAFLLAKFQLHDEDLHRVRGPVNLHRLASLRDLVDRPDLAYPPVAVQASARDTCDWFERLRQQDVVLLHPTDSTSRLLEFLRQAVEDPCVVAIQQTLFRAGPASPFVDALAMAAQRGKSVLAIVELRAHTDDVANILIGQRLADAGVNVTYGAPDHTAHASAMLIIRREVHGLRTYVQLGTGDYRVDPDSRVVDVSLLSSQLELTHDVQALFRLVAGRGGVPTAGGLLASPFNLRSGLIALVEAEMGHARVGRGGRIVARVNALTDPELIDLLYRASQAGVAIDLLVRGVCCLRPGVPGWSEHIRVRSLVGRWIEHARVAWFASGGQDQVWCGTGDWTERGLGRQVDAWFPVADEALKRRLIDETLAQPWRSAAHLWQLDASGEWRLVAQ